MEKVSKKSNKILDYIKNVIFFRVSKDEKDYIKKETLKTDHIVFRRMLVIVCICQIIMIIYRLAASFGDYSDRDKMYLIVYFFLAVSSAILYPISEYFARKGNAKAYFTVVPIAINIVYIWGCAIALLDSKYSAELTTFAYVSLSLVAFIMLEPWVFILDSIGYSTILLCLFRFLPSLKEHFRAGVIISLITIALLTSIAATANFERRIEGLRVKRQNELLTDNLKLSAYRDELTRIHNRRYLTEHINDPINIGLHPSGALMMDIDRFKNINDQYGHQNGDIILQEVGKIIRKHLGTASKNYAVRYGGEEFLIFIEHTTQDDLVNFAEGIRKEVEDTDFVLLDSSIIKVRISCGASLAITGINYTQLINNADNNLYEAKRLGRNRTIFK